MIPSMRVGVEPVAKLGPPKVHLQALTGYEQDGNTTTRHEPDKLETHYKGKSAILRRPKYQAVAYPRRFEDKRGYNGHVGVTPNQRVTTENARRIAAAHEGRARRVTLRNSQEGRDNPSMPHVSKAATMVVRRAARAAGYPVKRRPVLGVKMAPSGQVLESVSHEGREGTWAFKPSGKTSLEHITSEGKHVSRREVVQPLELTRRGKQAAAGAVGTAYAGGVTAAHLHERRKLKKVYTPGSITLHQEQANLHARKKASGRRQAAGGVTAATAGLALHRAAPAIGQFVTREGIEMTRKPLAAAEHGRLAAQAAKRGGMGVMAGGAALAGLGAARAAYHGTRQNRETRAAQQARRSRNASLVKAFDSERQRHRREGLYEGGAAGGSVASAVEARRRGKRAGELRSEAKGQTTEGRAHLLEAAKRTNRLGGSNAPAGGAARAMANTAGRHINQAGVKLTEAERLGRKAAWAARQSKLAAAGSAGLAAGAYGLHRLNS